MYPRVLCIDGVDGIGKATVTNIIKKRFEDAGYKIFVISPPFYETNTGKDVREYLTNGYKGVRDRTVASMMYSQDRNMFYRDHFDEIFCEDSPYDFVIYDRNWLSNLFFNTTMELQSEADEKRFASLRHLNASTPELELYPVMVDKDRKDEMYGEDSHIQMSLGDMHKYLEGRHKDPKYNPDEDMELALTMLHITQRIAFLRRSIDLIFRTELAPWPVATNAYNSERPMCLPMVVGVQAPLNIVLIPDIETGGMEIVRKNLMKRYEGDTAKLDRNEINLDFLESVVENIEWIATFGSLLYHDNWMSVMPVDGIDWTDRRDVYRHAHDLLSVSDDESAERVVDPYKFASAIIAQLTGLNMGYHMVDPLDNLYATIFDYQIINATSVDEHNQACQPSPEEIADCIEDYIYEHFHIDLSKRYTD